MNRPSVKASTTHGMGMRTGVTPTAYTLATKSAVMVAWFQIVAAVSRHALSEMIPLRSSLNCMKISITSGLSLWIFVNTQPTTPSSQLAKRRAAASLDVNRMRRNSASATKSTPPIETSHIHLRDSPIAATPSTARTGRAILASQSHTPAASNPAETACGVIPHDMYMA